MKVAVVMRSTSDLSKVEPAILILKEYGVETAVGLFADNRIQVVGERVIIK